MSVSRVLESCVGSYSVAVCDDFILELTTEARPATTTVKVWDWIQI